MKFATMLKDVLGSLVKPPFTEKYPFEKKPAPERLRGKLVWNPEKCTGCCLCNKDCPSAAIELITLDKKARRFVMRYHADRCTYCAQCVQNCRFECIGMSHDQWELAALDKQPFEVYYGRDEDIQTLLAKLAEQPAGEPAAP
jgi:formate hydrogenlyase subunit 6/NADH:ubiquinone oxidoreductase subunit I